MRSFIISGDLDKRNEFIADYIKKEEIPGHAVSTFDENMGIKEARNFRLKLSKKYSGKNLYIIASSITAEAQNALLKSFEEIPDSVSVVISIYNPDELLDTVRSRFFELSFKERNTDKDTKEFDTKPFLAENVKDKVLLIDDFLLDKGRENSGIAIDQFIASYRMALVKNINNLEKDRINKMVNTLKNLLSTARLVKFNNLNLRLALENALLNDKL